MPYAEAILSTYDENAGAVAEALRMLSLVDETRDWYGEVAAAAQQWQPFIDRGLAIDTWLVTVANDLL